MDFQPLTDGWSLSTPIIASFDHRRESFSPEKLGRQLCQTAKKMIPSTDASVSAVKIYSGLAKRRQVPFDKLNCHIIRALATVGASSFSINLSLFKEHS